MTLITKLHSESMLRHLRGQASRLCRDAQVNLPDELLHEGLPPSPQEVGGPASARAASLVDLTEKWVAEHPDRKGTGLFLTPPDVARSLIAVATRDYFRPRSVLDPSVGGGVFLAEALVRFGPDVELFGVDNDPVAVALTRLTLWLMAVRSGRPFDDPYTLIDRIRWADALFDVDTWKSLQPSRGFDLVCGNPPFGNAIEKRTARTSRQNDFLKAEFPESARGPYDRSVLFVQLSAQMLARNGRLALLVPRALLSARYAEGLRGWLAREVPLAEVVRYPKDAPIPDAKIAMVGWIAQRGSKRSDVQILSSDNRQTRRLPREVLHSTTWGGLLHPLSERLERGARQHPTMGESFTVRSGAAVAEAYEMVGRIRDGGDGWRFLTAGLLTRHGDRWGERRALHLGHRFMRPILPFDAPALTTSRSTLYAARKIIVAGLSRILKARCDAEGRYAASVGTLLVVPRGSGEIGERLLRRGTLMLNSAYLSEVHRSRYGPMSLSGENLPLGRRNVEAFPFPTCLVRPAARLGRGAIEGHLQTPEMPLPGDEPLLLALLDAAFDALSFGRHEVWDQLAQRVILALAGCSEDTATAILEAWSGRAAPTTLSSPAPQSCSRGIVLEGGSPSREG